MDDRSLDSPVRRDDLVHPRPPALARFHLGDGSAPDGVQLLRPDTLAYMQSSLAPAGSLADAVGITWQISDVAGVRLVGHGGSWCNQMSAFRMAPERRFAVVVLTNAHRGAELHGEVVTSALRHYLGAIPAKEEYLNLAVDQLQVYAGRYNALIDDVQLGVGDGGLILETVWRGNPLGTQPEAPPSPPVRLAFRGENKVVALDPPMKGNRGEFLRHPNGSIAWLRWGGRIHARQG
jgi:hypothetical protein